MTEESAFAISSAVAPPRRCVRLEAMAAELGGRWSLRAPATRISYATPSWTAPEDPEVAAYFRSLSSTELTAEGTAWLPAGRVWGDGVVLSPDGESLARDVSPDFGRAETEHWLLERDKKLRPPAALPAGPVAVAAAHLGRGYGHWLLDELPRLLALRAEGGCDAGDVRAYLAHAGMEYAKIAHTRLGIDAKILPAERATHFAGGPLIVPSYVGRPGFARSETLALLRDFASGPGSGGGARAERVYVTREAARRRRVVDGGALRAMLEARGFVTVRLEELGWAEQIAAFRAAKVVVAPHGAGLANLVFAERGTRVVELFRRDYVNPCYWRVAALAGLDYRPVVAAGEGPPREEPAAGARDIALDPAALAAVAAALGE